MKHLKIAISIALACIAGLCIFGVILLGVRQGMDYENTQNTLEDLRTSAKPQEGEPDNKGGTVSLESITTALPATEAPASTSKPSDTTVTPAPATSAPAAETQAPATATPEATRTPEPTAQPAVNPYRDSFLANKDMAAWLQIPGTVIDYPVMWTPGNEEYYLYRGFDGKSNQNGCLILDTDSCLDPLSTNLIIHGHNMKSGAMFGNLTDYEKFSYYEKHKEIILYTEGLQRNYEVIAVFRSQVFKKTDKVFKFYKFFQADTQEEFDDFYKNIKALSLYDTGVTAQFGDHFLTLSTCVYHVEQGRFVVVAKEVESGDNYLPLAE